MLRVQKPECRYRASMCDVTGSRTQARSVSRSPEDSAAKRLARGARARFLRPLAAFYVYAVRGQDAQHAYLSNVTHSLNLEVPGASTMNDETKRIDTRYIVHACGVHTCSVFGTSGVGVCAHMGDRVSGTPRLRVLIVPVWPQLVSFGLPWSASAMICTLEGRTARDPSRERERSQ